MRQAGEGRAPASAHRVAPSRVARRVPLLAAFLFALVAALAVGVEEASAASVEISTSTRPVEPFRAEGRGELRFTSRCDLALSAQGRVIPVEFEVVQAPGWARVDVVPTRTALNVSGCPVAQPTALATIVLRTTPGALASTSGSFLVRGAARFDLEEDAAEGQGTVVLGGFRNVSIARLEEAVAAREFEVAFLVTNAGNADVAGHVRAYASEGFAVTRVTPSRVFLESPFRPEARAFEVVRVAVSRPFGAEGFVRLELGEVAATAEIPASTRESAGPLGGPLVAALALAAAVHSAARRAPDGVARCDPTLSSAGSPRRERNP